MMPDFGFPTQHRSKNMSLLISALRDRSDDSRVESVTGRFADVTAELGGNVNEVMQIEKALSDLEGYGETIALAEARSDIIQKSLGRIREVAQVLADTTDLLGTNGTNQDFESISSQAREELASIVSALNTQFAGRPLFSGDDGNGSAIIDHNSIQGLATPLLEGAVTGAAGYTALIADFSNAGGVFDTSIYQGGTGVAPAALVSAGESVDYAVKADESALRSVLANVAALGAAFDMTNTIPDSQRKSIAQLASGGLRSDISLIIQTEGRVGAAESRIATIKARNTASSASLTIAFNDLAGADQLNAAIELTELERQLETAFATTARMSNLSLVNFL